MVTLCLAGFNLAAPGFPAICYQSFGGIVSAISLDQSEIRRRIAIREEPANHVTHLVWMQINSGGFLWIVDTGISHDRGAFFAGFFVAGE